MTTFDITGISVTGNKSLYRVHCVTFGLARELLGCPGANAFRGNHVLVTFRAFPRYRTAGAKKLRQAVAAMCRDQRSRTYIVPADQRCRLEDM